MENALTLTLEDGLGPKMLALTELQREFVRQLFARGTRSPTKAARAAGYMDNGNLAKTAGRLWHHPKVQAALMEESQRRLHALAPLALNTVLEIMTSKGAANSDRRAAAQMVLDRIPGLHSVSEHKTTIEHIGEDPDQMKRIALLAAATGMNLEQLLGHRLAQKVPVTVIDSEFTEVPNDD